QPTCSHSLPDEAEGKIEKCRRNEEQEDHKSGLHFVLQIIVGKPTHTATNDLEGSFASGRPSSATISNRRAFLPPGSEILSISRMVYLCPGRRRPGRQLLTTLRSASDGALIGALMCETWPPTPALR